jgi:hypothetical protein
MKYLLRLSSLSIQILMNLFDKLEFGELILIHDQRKPNPKIRNARTAKKFFNIPTEICISCWKHKIMRKELCGFG